MNNNIDYSVFFEVYNNFKNFIQEIETYKDKIATVKMFEICLERSFKIIKQLLKYEGIDITNWPRDIVRKAAIAEIISDPKEWFCFIEKKNLIKICYKNEILNDIILCFDKFSKALDELNDFIKNNINFQYNENFHNKINIDYQDWIIFKKIFQRYLDKDNDFRDKYNNICNIYVFGSRSKGNSLKFSDIDLYIDSDFFPIKDLKNDFDNSDLPFSVSIKSPKFFNFNSAKKDFIHLNILLKQ